jgi:hypothetical protein
MFNRIGVGKRLVLLPLVVLAISCSKNSDKEVAKVGESLITVANVVDVMSSGGYEESEQGAREALEYLIDFQLILMEAGTQGLEDSPEYLDQMKRANNQLLIRKLMEVGVYDKAVATEEDIRMAYEERGGDREEFRVRHILISVPPRATEEESNGSGAVRILPRSPSRIQMDRVPARGATSDFIPGRASIPTSKKLSLPSNRVKSVTCSKRGSGSISPRWKNSGCEPTT